MLITCEHCGGFIPAEGRACPNCDAAVERRAGKLKKVAGMGAMMVALMACYGGPMGYGECYGDDCCGNYEVDPDEECDDGNTHSGDGCSATCQLETCGDGNLDADEQCDDGNTQSGDGCDPYCRYESGSCGNGIVETGEECDDGNTSGGDGCNAHCELEYGCGDGVVNETGSSPEECDDGNIQSGDGCSAFCELELCALATPAELGENLGDTSGNAVLHSHTACDGYVWSGPEKIFAFTPTEHGMLSLKLTSATAHGVYVTRACTSVYNDVDISDPEGGESCTGPGDPETLLAVPVLAEPLWIVVDTTNAQATGPFTLDIAFTAGCGDGTVQDWASEQCDDGNTADGDGCDASCQLEPASVCNAPATLNVGLNSGDTSGSAASAFGGSDCDGKDEVYLFTAPSDGTLSLILDASYDVSLKAFDTTCPEEIATPTACIDAQPAGSPEVLSVYLTQGQQQWVVVDGDSPTDVGPYSLNATFTP